MDEKSKWNKRYANNSHIILEHNHILQSILELNYLKKDSLDVLDLACGMGRNTQFIAKNYKNHKVDSIDISNIAINHLSSLNLENVETICADINYYKITKKYDLVLKFLYLNRDVLKNIKKLLKPNAIMIASLLVANDKLDNANFLQDYEIEEIFCKYKIIYENYAFARRKNEIFKILEIVVQN